MSTVTVRYFAAFRDATGVEHETVQTAAVTLRDLFEEVSARHSGLQTEAASLVAVNDEMSSWQREISDGDEVLFFPPVAGG